MAWVRARLDQALRNQPVDERLKPLARLRPPPRHVRDGQRPRSGQSQQHQLVEARNTLRLPAYARLDIRADRTFTWSRRRFTLFGEVANALNHRNLRNVPYDVDRSGHVFDPTGSLLPILPSAGFVIEF